jgi:hypothetical protein
MLGLIQQFLPFLAIVAISFACGYAVRAWKSRRRRAAEREKFLERHPEFRK